MTQMIRGSKGCFPGGVLVRTPSGDVPISKLEVGDSIYCFDNFDSLVQGRIVETFKHTWRETNSELIKITTETTELEVTKNHWVFTPDRGYVEAGDLFQAEYIVLENSEATRILNIEEIPPIEYTYNLTVEPYHTFIANGIRVHNKGGGKDQRKPVEEPDNLKSKAYAKVIDLVCEGEIEGFVTPDDILQSIYLDDVPIHNKDGSENYEPNYTIDYRTGQIDQDPFLGFSGIQAPVSVSKELKRPYEITRRISGATEIDAIQMVFKIPSLVKNNKDNGDILGYKVEALITIYDGNRTIIHNRVLTVEGKTTSGSYQTSLTFTLPHGTGPWDVKVERLTENDADRNEGKTKWRYQSSIVWDYYNVVYYEKLSYPGSAMVALSMDAEQFGAIPRRGYHLNLLRIKVPSNYTPAKRDHLTNTWTAATYDGIWDGTFKIAWSSNPAWCYYDMLTNERYGLGSYLEADTLDKWSLYEIAKYCDEMVDTGFFSAPGVPLKEPRFSCNIYFQSREEAFTILNTLTGVFRGMSYWGNDRLMSIQDSPSDPIALFTNANVKNGIFNYQGVDLNVRHSSVLVSWNDPEDFFTRKIEYVEDDELIEKFGVRELNIDAAGCISRSQAHRLGKWLLYTEKYESSLINFSAGLSSGLFFPGAVIQVLDKDRAGKRTGGRIVSSTDSQLVIDSEVELRSGSEYSLTYETVNPATVTNPDGSITNQPFPDLNSIVLANLGETTNTLQYTTTGQPLANKNGIWSLSEVELQPQTFSIVSITEQELGLYNITARGHHPDKYDLIEKDIDLTPIPISQISLIPKNPSNFTMTEELYIDSGKVKVRGFVEWDFTAPGDKYTVFYRYEEGVWEPLVANYSGTSKVMDDIVPGDYEFRITTTNVYGRTSGSYIHPRIFTILGKTSPPADVSNFTVFTNAENVILRWDPVADLDLAGYEIQRFDGEQHTNWLINGFSPEVLANPPADYVPLITKYVGNNFTTDILDEDFEFSTERKFTYSIKAIDTSGNYSLNPASVELVLTLPDSVLGFNAVQMRDTIRFTWLPVSHRRLVGYEIRQGPSWDRASSIATVSDTQHALAFSALTSKKFWIKAIASPGIFSKIASSSTIDIAKPIDLNVLANFDQKQLGWPGRKIAGYVSDNDFSTDLGVKISEYYSDISLPKEYRNIVTIDQEVNTFLEGSELEATWDTFIQRGLDTGNNTYGPVDSDGNPTAEPAQYVHLTWGSGEASRTWSLAIQEQQSLRVTNEIAIKTSNFIDYQIGSIPFDNSLDSRQPDYDTVVPQSTTFTSPKFGPNLGRYSQGLDIAGRIDPLEYAVSIPDNFSLMLWGSSNLAESYAFVKLYNTGTGDYIEVKYSYTKDELFLDDGSGEPVGIKVTAAREVTDTQLWCIGITQSSTQLILQLGSLSGTVIASSAKELAKTAPTYDKFKVI